MGWGEGEGICNFERQRYLCPYWFLHAPWTGLRFKKPSPKPVSSRRCVGPPDRGMTRSPWRTGLYATDMAKEPDSSQARAVNRAPGIRTEARLQDARRSPTHNHQRATPPRPAKTTDHSHRHTAPQSAAPLQPTPLPRVLSHPRVFSHLDSAVLEDKRILTTLELESERAAQLLIVQQHKRIIDEAGTHH